MLMPKECFWFSYGFTSYPPESELGIEQLTVWLATYSVLKNPKESTNNYFPLMVLEFCLLSRSHPLQCTVFKTPGPDA